MFIPSDSEWLGILRLTPIVLGSLLLFSGVDLGLAVTYARQLYHAPLDESKMTYSKDKHWSTAWFIFYSGFFPLISLTHAVIDSVLFIFAQLSPVYTLIVSMFFFIGWVIQISFWCHCDYAPNANTCYQFYVLESVDSEMSGSLTGVSNEVTTAKVGFAMVLLICYLMYAALAAIAMRVMGESGHVRIVEHEEHEVGSHDQIEGSNRSNSDHSDLLLP